MLSNRAYVLVRAVPHRTREAVGGLREHPEMKAVDIITGPYDIIATVEAPTADEVLDLVMDQIRHTEGIVDTITCFVVQADI